MKKFVILSALAVALAGVPAQEASANGGGFNIKMGIGLNLVFDWNTWCNPCQQGCSSGGHGCGSHGGLFGHRHGHQNVVFGFPDGSVQYQGEHFTPPPPRKEGKGKDRDDGDQTIFQNYNYPNLGYTVQPASYRNPQGNYYPQPGSYYYGYPQYYQSTPGFRFDQ